MRKELQLKKSLALLGHGKWKSALGHTLLIIGMVLVSLGVYAQTMTPIPEGLVMEKKWQSDDPTGRTGNILVETYVTGHSIAKHVPTDIVLVLDVSGSMEQKLTEYSYVPLAEDSYSFRSFFDSGNGGNTGYYFLYEGQYCEVVAQREGGGGNRTYNLHFNYGSSTYYLSGTGVQTTNPNVSGAYTPIWTGVLYDYRQPTRMEALKISVGLFVDIIANDATQFNVDHRISIVKYAMNRYYGDNDASIAEGDHSYRYSSNLTNANYTEVVIARRDPKTQANYIKTQVNDLHAAGATAADFGMSKARYLLASIPAAEFEERNKVVVMFTDGSPTYSDGFQTQVATNTISNAHDLKHSWTNNGSTYQFDATVFSVGVFSTLTDQIRTYMERVSSNYPDAMSYDGEAGTHASDDYFFTAESADGLSHIFESIAGASGALPISSTAMVQDMVSPNFQLPEGASGTVTAYAPKFTGINETTGEYEFEEINDGDTLNIVNGVVVPCEEGSKGCGENVLPEGFVTVNGKTIQLEGFNYSEQWCGNITDDHGVDTPHGRKIVIKIPVVVNEGTWGDGIATNDPANSYLKVPDPNNPGQYFYYGPFNNLTTNVMGDVWTEVVVKQPEGYNRDSIDTPEELAWFISEVNGRIHYNDHEGQSTNNVASNTTLNGRLTADIDMSAHNWVPIGAGYKCDANNNFIYENGNKIKLAYEGEFDGNGHVITGLKNNADKWYKTAAGTEEGEVVVYPGMFSNIGANGKVHDVFILDADFRGKRHNTHFVHHGILADTLTGGTIYNCEAAGRMTCNNDAAADSTLVYGGLVGLNDGGTIYNAMAMAKLTGYTMGGAVGENRSGSFKNGFTNGEYHYIGKSGTNAKKVGGLAATNAAAATIDNCYVRFERYNENLDKATFDQLVGSGTATNSYTQQLVTWSRPSSQSITTKINTNPTVPDTITNPVYNDVNSYTISVNKTFYNMFTNDNSTGGTWGTLTLGNNTFNVYKDGTPLVDKLNANKGNGAEWKRTTAGKYSLTAGDINDDFPVLQLPGYTCLASTDGITIDYAATLDQMLDRHNTGNINSNSEDYNKTKHEPIYGGTINLYDNETNVTKSTMTATSKDGETKSTVVYVDENVSLLQNAESSIDAYTSQTLKAKDNTSIDAGYRWHLIGSSLSDSQFGWSYGDNGVVPSERSDRWDEYASSHSNRKKEDPCLWNLNNQDEDEAFYPIDLSSYSNGDFYSFFEPEYHWINFRRNSQSHWHMDNPDQEIEYYHNLNGTQVNGNETQFIPGKGYLAAVNMSTWWNFTQGDFTAQKQAQFMQNRGTLNNGNVPIKVTCTDGIGWTGRQGYNLLGNPYQSYLDFEKFIEGNSGLWNDGDTYAETYAVYDPEKDAWLQYGNNASAEALAASQYINMHQGFFIQTSKNNVNATFTNAMRTNTKGSGFRGNENHYPLVNFTLTDDEGNKDIAVLEVSRPENDGAKKIFVSTSKGRLSLRHDNEDFAILFRDMQSGSQPLYFEAKEDGTFTLSWNTANANFSSLTLVDNLTGVKYDMLTNDSYTFQGSMSDYRSRFKVVFGAFTDVEENEEVVTDNFAFFDGSDWVVNGQGQLTVTDMTGRTVYTSNLTNDQNRVSLNGVANGIYLMRVANGQNVNVQKIIIK